ncbi:hypothetical protein M2451_003842 [Dysgonomonas sp. PFB1-18]|uniref:hypothetical protein n=1 Tax=unclassified Dysgonomonas TaxID=2630389 RepID=UPI002474D3E2|nr:MULTISPECIES: hypothetical protein [unclassified Dysgonomonas]MDH6309476.1 hypothetical protein [Dysgonomonas sp. PF1-14]MDH6340886.1 hypothetical protein [Dysgonomonas sp. PF1-16]MDH6382501.1 hypothetical protein [Dysgonomonas sp. PFB1-18]MDH6399855.1 hypothetical protein [Dysgonomonas sp. PF1-23]
MKSKEAIRNKIIHYANMVWGTKKSGNFNPLFQLMVEEVCNELYLLDNKLNDIDVTILEKLVKTLSPSMFGYVRPAHGILQVRPDTPVYRLSKNAEFSLKELSDNLKNTAFKPPVFSPLTDTVLHDACIRYMFYNQSLWTVDEQGNKSLTTTTEKKAVYNTIWLQLEIDTEIKQLENLFFYIDFPHLNDNHNYYDLLSTIRWSSTEHQLNARKGFPVIAETANSNAEKDILHFYESHFQTLTDILYPDDIAIDTFPAGLQAVIPEDIIMSLPHKNWLSITFPPHFEESDLEKMIIVLNAFPALNRRYNEDRQPRQNLSNIISLPSEIGEEFLEIESVTDTDTIFHHYDTAKKKEGSYTVTPIHKKRIDDIRIYDHLERFIDVIQSEKTAFPKINEEKILDVLNLLSDIQDKENQRFDLNRMNEYADVARLTVHPYDTTTTVVTSYWTTLAGQVNGLEKGTALMATTIPALNKNKAVFLSPVTGGHTFYDIESLKAINRFFLTSKGRILTKHDIVSYCQLEIGKYAEDINVKKAVKISPKFKEGLINVMEIRIRPKERYADYLNKKEVVRDLHTRLIKRSPNNYNYEIIVTTP